MAWSLMWWWGGFIHWHPFCTTLQKTLVHPECVIFFKKPVNKIQFSHKFNWPIDMCKHICKWLLVPIKLIDVLLPHYIKEITVSVFCWLCVFIAKGCSRQLFCRQHFGCGGHAIYVGKTLNNNHYPRDIDFVQLSISVYFL